MVLDAVSNFVRGNTDAEVGTEDTTVSVDDASIFPDPATDGEFNVVIWDVDNFPRPDQDGDVEIMRVTARDTDTNELTVTRGQEMTSAAAHPEGSAIHLSPTAKMFSDIEAEYTAQGENFDGQGTSEFSNLQSVNTEALEVGGDDVVLAVSSGDKLVQYSNETFTIDDPATDNTWDTNNLVRNSISFSQQFGSTPSVNATANATGVGRGLTAVSNISTTGFDLDVRYFSTTAGDDVDFSWIAVGDK